MKEAEKLAQQFLTRLSARLERMDWPVLAVALRQDAWVWEQITQSELGNQALERLPGRLESWWPADLALTAMESQVTRTEIAQLAPDEIPEALFPALESAKGEWTGWAAQSASGLKEAGSLALYLRYLALSMSWEQAWKELNLSDHGSLGDSAWSRPLMRAGLVVLYGLLPKPEQMLQALFQTGEYRLALHILLANPAPEAAQIASISALLEDLSLDQALESLQALAQLRPSLAAQLAASAYHGLHKRAEGSPEHADHSWARIIALNKASEVLRSSGELQHTQPMLVQALNEMREMQAELSAQLAQGSTASGDYKTALRAWKQALQIEPASARYAAGLGLTLIDAGKLDEAESFLTARLEENDHALLWIANALLRFRQGEKEQAAESASQALANLESQVAAEDFDAVRQFAELLLGLGFARQAVQTAAVANGYRPDDPQILQILAQGSLESNDLDVALVYAHILTGLQPGEPEHRKRLVQIHESAGNWQPALAERRSWFKTLEGLPAVELRALAHCANQAGETKLAVQACRQVLNQNPEDGLAFALLGEAELAQGKNEVAVDHLRRATQLAPGEAAPWLALARAWKIRDQAAQAFETLQAASQAVPDDPEIALVLGEAWLEAESPTQALSSLRRAASLLENEAQPRTQHEKLDMRIRLLLGQTLHRLGHLEEAYQTLEPAYSRHPAGRVDPEIAYAFARVALARNDHRTAMKALQEVVLSEPADPAPYLDLARTLLHLPNGAADKGRAVPLLKRALELDPQNRVAQAYLAEAYAATGKYESAMQAYRQVLEGDLARDPEWRVRLAIGFGTTAVKVGQVDAAIATLREIDRAAPNLAEVQRALSEALLTAELYQDSLAAARQALRCAPSDPDTFTWFADQAFALAAKPGLERANLETEAAQALSEALKLAPNRPELALRLGNLHLQRRDAEEAVKAFEHIARIAALELPELDPGPLYEAAVHLRKLGRTSEAIGLLKATTRYLADDRDGKNQAPDSGVPSEPRLPEDPAEASAAGPLHAVQVWKTLAAAYQEADDLAGALAAMDQAVRLQPFNAYLQLSRAELLLQLGRTSMAQASLQEAKDLGFSDAASFFQASRLLFQLKELDSALEYAQKAVAARPAEPALRVQSAELAAELTWSMLDAEGALALLKEAQIEKILATGSVTGERKTTPAAEPEGVDLVKLAGLYGELALETGDLQAAERTPLLTEVESLHKPRLLAVHARLMARRDGPASGETLYEQALAGLPATEDENGQTLYRSDPAVLRGLSLAALELNDWPHALKLAHSGLQAAGSSPLLHLIEARILVQRAEAQRVAQITRLPLAEEDQAALGPEAKAAFEQAISAAQAEKQIRAKEPLHWAALGQAAFSPSLAAAKELEPFTAPLDQGARLLALLTAGEQEAAEGLAVTIPSGSPAVFFASLALAQANPDRAYRLASQAGLLPSVQLPGYWYLIPAAKVLQARLALSNEVSGVQARSAQQALNEALRVWPLEAGLYALAARLILKTAGASAGKSGPAAKLSSASWSVNSGSPALSTPDFQAAKAHLEEAVRLEPENQVYNFEFGSLLVANGDVATAAPYLKKAAERAPDDEQAWYLLAQAEYRMGNYPAAAKSAEKASEIAAEPSAALLLLGEIALHSETPQSAQNRAQSVLQKEPQNLNALRLLARSLEAQNRTDEALSVLEKAVPLAQDPLPLLLDAVRLVRQNQGGQAGLVALQELVEQFPNDARVLAPLSEALRDFGRTQEAVDAARKALNASLNGLEPQEQAALHTMIGGQLRASGQLDQAIHHLSAAVECAPGYLDAYLELGQALLDRRQHFQALEIYDRAISVDPKDYRPYYQAAVALKDGKDYPAAEEKLRKAAALAPDEVSVRRLLSAVVAINLVHNR